MLPIPAIAASYELLDRNGTAIPAPGFGREFRCYTVIPEPNELIKANRRVTYPPEAIGERRRNAMVTSCQQIVRGQLCVPKAGQL